MNEQAALEYLSRLTEWFYIGEHVGKNESQTIDVKYSQIKIIASIPTSNDILSMPIILDTNTHEEGGKYVCVVGYSEGIEYYATFELSISNTSITDIALSEAGSIERVESEAVEVEEPKEVIFSFPNFTVSDGYGSWNIHTTYNKYTTNPNKSPAISGAFNKEEEVFIHITHSSGAKSTSSVIVPSSIPFESVRDVNVTDPVFGKLSPNFTSGWVGDTYYSAYIYGFYMGSGVPSPYDNADLNIEIYRKLEDDGSSQPATMSKNIVKKDISDNISWSVYYTEPLI